MQCVLSISNSQVVVTSFIVHAHMAATGNVKLLASCYCVQCAYKCTELWP